MSQWKDACRLCGEKATVGDDSPIEAWLAVEGCQCGDYRVERGAWDKLLGRMPAYLDVLRTRVGQLRAEGRRVSLTSGASAEDIIIEHEASRNS